MTKAESVWNLTHQKLKPLEALVRPQHTVSLLHQELEPVAELPHQPPAMTDRASSPPRVLRNISLPTERDYARMQSRLTKLSTGVGLTLRAIVIPEGKSLELRLEEDEWQYMKVRLLGKPVPLEITQRRSKGKALLYLSKEAMEPSETFHDEVHKKEVVIVKEKGLRFKSEWLYLGVKCLDDLLETISIRFGMNAREDAIQRNKGLMTLDDLEVFRHDDIKRENLTHRVNNIVQKRKLDFQKKYSSRNFLAENKDLTAELRAVSPEKSRLEELHRSRVYERCFQLSEAKRIKAEESLQRQERRKAERQQAILTAQLLDQQQSREKTWLSYIALAQVAEALMDKLAAKKAAIREMQAKGHAALVIQRCYRRMAKLNPRRLAVQRAMHSLQFQYHLLLPVLRPFAKILTLVRKSYVNSEVMRSVLGFFRAARKMRWHQTLAKQWKVPISLKVESPDVKKRKKTKKPKDDKGNHCDPQARDLQIQQFWARRRQEFHTAWKEFVLSQTWPKPSFNWEWSDEDLQALGAKAVEMGKWIDSV